MKSYQSNTTNGGTTIILDSVSAAIARGTQFIDGTVARFMAKGDTKIKVTQAERDKERKKGKQMNCSTFSNKWDTENRQRYNACCDAIVTGDPKLKDAIASTLETLRDLSLEIEPMLALGYRGYERAEDGFTAAPELVAAGEENACFRRKRGSDEIAKRTGDGAFRVVINTDVAWWGRADDNAAVMGALITLLQQFGPVEVWIQQGWLTRSSGKQEEGDGVTLFKLDFTGSFDATALAFWLSHEDKDNVFSYCVNKNLGRNQFYTSSASEIPCDLYMRGDWMTLAGLSETALVKMDCIQRHDAMARWIAGTAMQILHPEQPVITIEA